MRKLQCERFYSEPNIGCLTFLLVVIVNKWTRTLQN